MASKSLLRPPQACLSTSSNVQVQNILRIFKCSPWNLIFFHSLEGLIYMASLRQNWYFSSLMNCRNASYWGGNILVIDLYSILNTFLRTTIKKSQVTWFFPWAGNLLLNLPKVKSILVERDMHQVCTLLSHV